MIVLGVEIVVPIAVTFTLPPVDVIVAPFPTVAVDVSRSSVMAIATWMPAGETSPTRPDEAWANVDAAVVPFEPIVTSPAARIVLAPVTVVVTVLSARA